MFEGEDPDTAEEPKNSFESLDLKSITIFGGKKTDEQTWAQLAEQSKTLGWKSIDQTVFQKSLARAVETCYFRLVSFNAETLDDEMRWHASFLNGKSLWDLELADSPKAPVEPEQMGEFFSSEAFKKIAKRAGWILKSTRDLISEVVVPHLEAGELLEVDEVKLAAIMHWLDDKQLLENLITGKFMSV